MARKLLSIPSVLLHLSLQLVLTFISSLHWLLLVIVSLAYVVLLFKEYSHVNQPSLLCNHYISTLLFTVIHFVFILAYNKLLPWEIGLEVLFLILILHYARRLGASVLKFDLAW